MSRGAGASTCGGFAKAYAHDPQNEYIFFSWAQGYMSAVNDTLAATGIHNYRDLAGETANQMARIRLYCNDHPLADYDIAVMDLYDSLPLKPLPAN